LKLFKNQLKNAISQEGPYFDSLVAHLESTIDDGGKRRKVDIRRKKDGFVVTIDGFPFLVDGKMLPDGRVEFTLEGKTFRAVVAQNGNSSYVLLDGHSYTLKQVEEEATDTQQEQEPSLNAPMPGRITKILVNIGDIVKPKQQLVILEAMKMEHVITAPYAGTVAKINFKVGEQVKEGQTLLKIDPMDKLEKKGK
jgi:biotin carboxyl carrier protein